MLVLDTQEKDELVHDGKYVLDRTEQASHEKDARVASFCNPNKYDKPALDVEWCIHPFVLALGAKRKMIVATLVYVLVHQEVDGLLVAFKPSQESQDDQEKPVSAYMLHALFG